MKRFDDLTSPPIAGRYYLVRCVRGFLGRHQEQVVADLGTKTRGHQVDQLLKTTLASEPLFPIQ